jgi:hypothetical protein
MKKDFEIKGCGKELPSTDNYGKPKVLICGIDYTCNSCIGKRSKQLNEDVDSK